MTIFRSKDGAVDQLPARRFVKDSFGLEQLVVESKTLGTNLSYNLSPRNFSRTGMLLSGGNYKNLPFKVNTLLELNIDTHGVLFPKPIKVLGKVVRLEGEMATGRGEDPIRYGVQILQMENEAMDQWADRLDALEKSSGHLLTAS